LTTVRKRDVKATEKKQTQQAIALNDQTNKIKTNKKSTNKDKKSNQNFFTSMDMEAFAKK